MALFSKQNKEVFTNPLNLDHPILGQVLGICSALAVTLCECDHLDYPQHHP